MAERISARISVLSGLLALGACSMPDMDSFRAPDTSSLFRPLSVTNYKDKVLPPVAADDLVDTSGRCAGAYVAPTAGEQAAGQSKVSLQDAGIPLVPSAIALEMSECDVVKRAGIAERVEIATNDRAERTTRLTYINGQRPGIYSFTAGRLISMERAPEPTSPQKPGKKPAKPAKRVAQPNSVSVQ